MEKTTSDLFVRYYTKTGGFRIVDPRSITEYTKWHLSHGAYGCPPTQLSVDTSPPPKPKDPYGKFEW